MSGDGGDTALSSDDRRIRRKPRPEIQLYRPGMLRKGDSTKALTSDENSRRKSGGDSGRTTPEVVGSRNGRKPETTYDSTQSLYDSRKPGGYLSSNHSNRNQRQHFNRSFGGGYNERSSMRGDGAITKRNRNSRRRNDSINSTQSEMPAASSMADSLQIDTSFDTMSQCGASSAFSMNSLGEAMSFDEICQSFQSMSNLDWSKQVELECSQSLEKNGTTVEEEEDAKKKRTNARLQEANGNRGYRRRNERRHRRDESDRESSFGGSIVEEEEEDDELKSGEKTPTSICGGYQYNGNRRGNYENNTRKNHRNHANENECNDRNGYQKKFKERRYRGEHDDRDAENTNYGDTLPTNGRLAGRLSIVKRTLGQALNQASSLNERQNRLREDYRESTDSRTSKGSVDEAGNAQKTVDEDMLKLKTRQNDYKTMELNIKEINDQVLEILPLVSKKKDVDAAKKMAKISETLCAKYSDIIFMDLTKAFMNGIEQKMFKNALYKMIEGYKSGANSTSPNAKHIRAVFQEFLNKSILFYDGLMEKYQKEYEFELKELLVWKNGTTSDEDLMGKMVHSPHGVLKASSGAQKTAIKSFARHLMSLGDLHRYKSLVEGCEDYTRAHNYYLMSAQLQPKAGHAYNQLGVVAYYSMLYRSPRRTRETPLDVLSRRRQKRVIDEIFYLVRGIACEHAYMASKDRLIQRLDAMRDKVMKYETVLDAECGRIDDEMRTISEERAKEVWMDVATGKATAPDSGEQIVYDILESFVEKSPSKLQRRTVPYLIGVYAIIFVKIGMDRFRSVSERAFALLYASLMKEVVHFSAHQLVQLAAIFLHGVVSSKQKSEWQKRMSLQSLLTYYMVLIKTLLNNEPKNEKNWLILPAINVISEWIRQESSRAILAQVDVKQLDSTILKDITLRKVVDEGLTKIVDVKEHNGFNYPEHVLLASFCECFSAYPQCEPVDEIHDEKSILMESRLARLVEACSILAQYSKHDEEEVKQEEAKEINRDDLLEMEKSKSRYVMVVQPENIVVDTNVFINELDVIKKIVDKKLYKVVVPTMVMSELLGLSLPHNRELYAEFGDSEHEKMVRENAQVAVSWLKEQKKNKTEQLATLTTQGSKISFLVAAELNSAKDKQVNDDVILNSCLKLIETSAAVPPPAATPIIAEHDNTVYRNVVLITEDRGLAIKAMSQRVPCRNLKKFVQLASI